MTAWAIIVDGEIDVRTVSERPAGAMVNWLVVSAGITVQHGVSDERIEQAFDHVREHTPGTVECCPVEVRRVLQ